ncbi:MAG: DnaJ like chaperone protein [Alteromonadaceae bacterium]|jgi:DnaJ like chaperone protein
MWGRVLGTLFGFMFGRVFGAILGFYVGYLFDRRLRQNFDEKGGFSRYFKAAGAKARQAIFFHSTFSVMGHIAKSNGRVNETHIQAANVIMGFMKLDDSQKKEAQASFREGKGDDFAFAKTLKDFKSSVFGRKELLQVFLEVQIQAAYSDGTISAQEKQLLQSVAKTFGFTDTELEAILKRWEAEFRFHQEQYQNGNGKGRTASKSALEDAYKVLGVKADSSSQDIKKAYKKQMNQHHPDKLMSKGLPPEMMDMAKRKAQDIQAAYDLVRQKAA